MSQDLLTSSLSELKIIPDTDPILKQTLDTFVFDGSVDTEELSTKMVDLMRASNGIGLAANQVGLPYRMFVIEGEPAYACFNPKVVQPGSESIILEEGCLTFPGLYVKVKRPRDIRVRFQGPDGETYTKTLTGISARVFQHELDHLDGICMINRASYIHKEQAMKRWKKLRKNINV